MLKLNNKEVFPFRFRVLLQVLSPADKTIISILAIENCEKKELAITIYLFNSKTLA